MSIPETAGHDAGVAGHTPGPWVFDWKSGEVYYADRDVMPLVATVNLEAVSNAQALADLRLIAAAPELLEALEKALPRLAHKHECWTCRPASEWAEHGSASFENCECEIKIVRAAIAKATLS